jgi:hypothetical protein
MKIPFTIDQFMDVFARYNLAIWPGQVIAYLFGAAVVFLAIRRVKHSDQLICVILSCFWVWNGVAYHLSFFSKINRMAFVFAVFFIFQGILFLWKGVIRPTLAFGFRKDLNSALGLLMILYAMIIYPLIGHLLGHSFPHSPVYGVAPCPTTIFTFGLLLFSARRVPVTLLLIPFFWAVAGTFAATSLGVWEDLGLTVSGIFSVLITLQGGKKDRREYEDPPMDQVNSCSINH